MAEDFHWNGQPVNDEDTFLNALVEEMNDAGPTGQKVEALLTAVKSTHPDWYQLGVSARGLRAAFGSSAGDGKVEQIGKNVTTPPLPSPLRPASQWLGKVAAGIGVLALAIATGVIVYGYSTRPTATDQAKVPPPTVTLTPGDLDAITKAANPDVSAYTRQIEQLKGELSQASTRSKQMEGDLAKLQNELAKQVDVVKVSEAKVTKLTSENTRLEKLAQLVVGEKQRLIVGDNTKEFILKAEGVATDPSKGEVTTCFTVPKTLKTPFLVVPKDGKLELIKVAPEQNDWHKLLANDKMFRPATIDK